MNTPTTELGRFIRARRLELGLTQAKVADEAGIWRSVLSAIETGKCKRLSDRQQQGRLAGVLKCLVEELLKRMPPEKKPYGGSGAIDDVGSFRPIQPIPGSLIAASLVTDSSEPRIQVKVLITTQDSKESLLSLQELMLRVGCDHSPKAIGAFFNALRHSSQVLIGCVTDDCMLECPKGGVLMEFDGSTLEVERQFDRIQLSQDFSPSDYDLA